MKLRRSSDLKTGIFSLGFKILSMAIAFGISIILARTIGADGLGVINLLDKIFTILVAINLLGSSNYVIKHVSYLFGERDFDQISLFLRKLLLQIGILGFVFMGINFFLLPKIFDEVDIPVWLIHLYSILLLPRVYAQLIALFLRAFGSITLSNLISELPVSYFRILGLSIFLLDGHLTTQEVLLGYCVAYGLFFIVSFAIFMYQKGEVRLRQVDWMGQKLMLAKDQLTFWGTNGLYIVNSNIDTIYVGYFLSFSDVAQYNVAWRLANLLMIFLNISNSIMAPKISRMYKRGEIGHLGSYIGRANLLLSIIAISYFLMFWFFGDYIVGFWGNDFLEINIYVLILIIGQGVNVATAGVGVLLSMTGNENIVFRINLIALLLGIVLYPLLLNQLGLIGGTIVSSGLICLTNFIKAYYVSAKLGISFFKLRGH